MSCRFGVVLVAPIKIVGYRMSAANLEVSFPTAQQSRDTSNTIRTQQLDQEKTKLRIAIQKATQEGHCFASIVNMSPEAQTFLEGQGYVVKPVDDHDGDYFNVQW